MSEPKKPSPEKPIDRRRFFEAAEEMIDRNRALSLEVDWLLRRAENALPETPFRVRGRQSITSPPIHHDLEQCRPTSIIPRAGTAPMERTTHVAAFDRVPCCYTRQPVTMP
jgi:hypothetical protein